MRVPVHVCLKSKTFASILPPFVGMTGVSSRPLAFVAESASWPGELPWHAMGLCFLN